MKVVKQLYSNTIKAILKQRADKGLPMTAAFMGDIWSALVGKDMASSTHPTSIGNGVLIVSCATPAWEQQMANQRSRLLKILNNQLPEPLDDIQFVPGTPALFPPQPLAASGDVPIGSLPMAEAQLLEDVEDEELRAVMTRVRRMARGRKE